jgi:hypothetical protein
MAVAWVGTKGVQGLDECVAGRLLGVGRATGDHQGDPNAVA